MWRARGPPHGGGAAPNQKPFQDLATDPFSLGWSGRGFPAELRKAQMDGDRKIEAVLELRIIGDAGCRPVPWIAQMRQHAAVEESQLHLGFGDGRGEAAGHPRRHDRIVTLPSGHGHMSSQETVGSSRCAPAHVAWCRRDG